MIGDWLEKKDNGSGPGFGWSRATRKRRIQQKHIQTVQTTQGWRSKKRKQKISRDKNGTAAGLRTLQLVELVYGKKVS